MKTSKLIAYYFMFWILYLPLSITVSLLFKLDLETFFIFLGIGALLLLVFLTVKFLLVKKKVHGKITPKVENAGSSETLMPKDEFEGFRKMFVEVNNNEEKQPA
ncbi:MAG TPA: hypothetical protein VJG30_03975 [Candidatus Nanoarchaeia archaeon]|nr:hypothetical protein [Candidatus Nanoarchaeia archaeon]